MTAVEVQKLLQANVDTVKIDVREDIELTHGVIEGAIHIPMQQIPEKITELEQYKSSTIVIICRSGMRSHQVGSFLEQEGFSDIINLEGGMNSWAADVDANMSVY